MVDKIIKKKSVDKLSGQVVTTTLTMHARKHPLSKLRVKLFEKYKCYMRLNTDSYFDNLLMDDIIDKFKLLDEVVEDTDVNKLKEKLK